MEEKSEFKHEIGHALSADVPNKRVGFTTIIEEGGRMKAAPANRWFNEGMTFTWAAMTANDGSQDTNEAYRVYSEGVKSVLEAAGVGIDDGWGAYFGDEEKRNAVEGKIRARFFCDIEDLACLFVKYDSELIRRIVRGKSVEIRQRKNEPESVKRKKEKLASLFPNVHFV